MKGVLITAGASGIGLAIARAFLSQGYEVHVCDINKKQLDELNGILPQINGWYCDVSDQRSIESLFSALKSAGVQIDVLINNAGVSGPTARIDQIADHEWENTLSINLTAPYRFTKHVSASMIQQRKGVIINISTASVRTGLPLRSAYVVSKTALGGLTKNTARELGPYNIRCNSILPGAIKNPRGEALVKAKAQKHQLSYDEALAQDLRYISMRCEIEMNEIADMALFLASNKALHISGQEIGVCGNAEWEE